MKTWLVSRCLLGEPCRYDGKAKGNDRVRDLLKGKVRVVGICPECDGGLPTPRTPSEIQGGDGADVLRGAARVVSVDGEDRTEAFVRGARMAVETARREGAEAALLKAKSPSCGIGRIYDGGFSGTLREGDGVTAAALRAAGLTIHSETDCPGEI